MVFGRKNKKKEEPEEIETEITEAKVEKGAATKELEPVKIPADLQGAIDDFKVKYASMFVETDFNKPEVQQLNLLFAIFTELKSLNKNLKEAIEKD